MDLDLDLVETDRLDRLVHLNLTLVQLDSSEAPDALNDISDRNRTVELALIPRLGGENHPTSHELGGYGLRKILRRALCRKPSLPDALGCFEGAIVRLDGVLLWQQIVAGKTVGNVDHVTAPTQIHHVRGEYQLHRILT